MRHFPVLLLAFALGSPVLAANDSASAKRAPDLVPKIDTTPDDLVSPPRPSWMAAGAKSAILPGWGQFQTGHPIRGSLLSILDVWLYSDAAYRTWSAIPKLRDKASAMEAREAVASESLLVRLDTARHVPAADLKTDSGSLKILRDSASMLRGRARISADYRNGEIAWAIGLHVYAIVDAAEAAWLASGGKRPVTEMSSALWRSLLVPGWGQIHNAHYSKAALLYMGVAGSVVSFFSRQEMVEFWQEETRRAIAEGRSTSTTVQQTEFFRKRRNQYVWGLGVVYVYQVLDAAVDARLSRFGMPFPLALEPRFDRPGLTASYRF